MDGAFPGKTQKLMKKIVSYYIDKKEINEKDVANYVKEATSLFKKGNDDSLIDVVFDTERNIKQMVGTGDCLIDGEIFKKELNDWKARQSKEKQEELQNCDELILDTVAKTKKGFLD